MEIDSLVVALGFDTSGLKKGEQEAVASLDNVRSEGEKAVEGLAAVIQDMLGKIVVNTSVTSSELKKLREESVKTANELESRGGQAAQFFAQIQNKVLGLAAAFVGFGAIKKEIVDVTLATADLGRAATVAGVNIGQLSAFANLIGRSGGTAAGGTSQILSLTSSLQQARTGYGSQDFYKFLGTIGAGVDDDAFTVLQKLANYAGQHKGNNQLVGQVAGWGGISDTATLAEILKGGSQYKADLEVSRQLTVATEADAKASRDLQTSIGSLKQAIEANTRAFVTKNAPEAESLLKKVTSWVNTHPGGPINIAEGALVGGIAGGFLDPFAYIAGAAVGYSASELGGSANGATSGGGSFGPRASLGFGSGTGSQAASGSSLLPLFRSLERSGDSATSYKGAVGRYQILPSTAREYGFDPSRLKDPDYNSMVASAILSDLYHRYNGNLDAVAVGYQSGKGAGDKFLASGGSTSGLGPQGRAYLAHEQLLSAGGHISSIGAHSTITSTTTIGTININTKATDAPGIAKSLRGVLAQNNIAQQANTGLQ
jgi:hypothetical protein